MCVCVFFSSSLFWCCTCAPGAHRRVLRGVSVFFDAFKIALRAGGKVSRARRYAPVEGTPVR